MPGYVQGFVLPVKKSKLKEYLKACQWMGRKMKKFGALQYMECVGADLKSKYGTIEFPKMARAKRGEVVIFSFITYRNKAHFDAVSKKMMADPEMNDPKNKDKPMPFEMHRMAEGGFKTFYEM